MKDILNQLLAYAKRDIPQLWKQPLFLSLFIVALLVAGLSDWILALVLWAIFASAIYLAKHFWYEDKHGHCTVDTDIIETVKKAAPQKATTKSSNNKAAK